LMSRLLCGEENNVSCPYRGSNSDLSILRLSLYLRAIPVSSHFLNLSSNSTKKSGFILFACGDGLHYMESHESADCVSEITETIFEIL
jgi:hypothetical protein